MSDSVRPHRRQPTRLRRPWDSPGKNTGVGCHFLLQWYTEYIIFTSLLYFLDSIYEWYHSVFVYLWFISLSTMLSKCIHVAPNDKMSLVMDREVWCAPVRGVTRLWTDYGWVVLHWIYVFIQDLYLLICWWTQVASVSWQL